MSDTLDILRPDDWHLHLRNDAILAAVTPHSSACFARVMVMPNLVPPITAVAAAGAYRTAILAAAPPEDRPFFDPRMTLYLTEETTVAEIEEAAETEWIQAIKLYPAGATTNSQSGVQKIDRVLPVLEKMAECDLPLLVHGEVTEPEIDIFDREAVFIERVLEPLRKKLPELRIVLEHITTGDGVEYVLSVERGLAGTITAHHLLLNRNDILAGGIRPHYYCLPVAKRNVHQRALRAAVTSGDRRFFFGSDSAPHLDAAKESECGCAGIFTAPNALPCLAAVFEEEGCLDRLEDFVSRYGALFYGLPLSTKKVRLVKTADNQSWPSMRLKEGRVSVFAPPAEITWRLEL